MSPRRALAASFAFAAVAATATVVIGSLPAGAQCNYPFLGSGSATYFPPGTTYTPTIVQSTNYWSAVAVRPDVGSDWDLSINTTAVAYPTCVSGQLTNSVRGGSQVDLVIGDFNHNAFGTFYARPYLFSGPGGATVEWDDGADQFPINAPRIERTTGPNDVIECWDIFLEANRNYSFETQILGGNNMKLLLFKNPANATYWGNRNSAYMEVNLPPNSNSLGGIQVDQTDWYGLVMLNENGAEGSYTMHINTCTGLWTNLTSTVTQSASEPSRHFTFTQDVDRFTAVAVRPEQPGVYWGVELGTSIPGPSPYCFDLGTYKGTDARADSVSYMIGDYTVFGAPIPEHGFVRVMAPYGTGSSTAKVEWDRGDDILVVGDAPTVVNTDANDLIKVWSVGLFGGNRYLIHFERLSGTANTNVALFAMPPGTNWRARVGATIPASGDFLFDAPQNDAYGIVVANDNGQAGSYEISISQPPIGVGDEPPAVVSGLERVLPNPSAGTTRIHYALAKPGNVSFEVVNAAGRRVARIADGAHEAGRWSVDWNGSGDAGARLPAGVYFVRMRVDGAPLTGATTVRLL